MQSELEKIEIKLFQQVDLIIEILESLQFLIDFPRFIEVSEHKKPQDLRLLYHVLRNNTILNFHKLFNHKEDYSLDRIKRLVLKVCDKNEDSIKEYLKSISKAKKLYDDLDIKSIRDTHVSHLDEDRENKSIDWNTVKDLALNTCEVHNKIQSILFNRHHFTPGNELYNKKLGQIFSNRLKSIELHKVRRNLFREDINSIGRDEIVRLTNINWT